MIHRFHRYAARAVSADSPIRRFAVSEVGLLVPVIALLLLLASCSSESAERRQREFLVANARYENGDYRGALAGYLKLAETGQVRANLYYNIANCYFKLGDLGKTTLYYERSLLLAPRAEDAKYNLTFARSRTVDEVNPPRGLEAIGEAISGGGVFSRREVWRGTAALYVLFFLLMACVLVFPERRALVHLRLVVLALCLCGFLLLGYLSWRSDARMRGVIMAAEVNVRNEPRGDGQVEFKLHEGTVVRMLGSYEEWQAIAVGEELKGWILETAVEVIRPETGNREPEPPGAALHGPARKQ